MSFIPYNAPGMVSNKTHFDSTYLYKSGWSDGFGNYRLRSFDCGETWYEFDNDTIVLAGSHS